ncbi:unnamed protein product [Leptosia nina]|uniref:Rhodanese domain-containing protein n=1 Tax=Leptosia nina TaxID=320188 RepID=A0AAV1JZF5_9NEOP
MFGIRRVAVISGEIQLKVLHHLATNSITKRQIPRKVIPVKYNRHYFSSKADPRIATYEDVSNGIKQPKTFIVDVRNPDEVQSTGLIPSSINIPLNNIQQVLSSMSEEEFKRNYQRNKPKQSDEIIFYCKAGNRATKATDLALSLGYLKSKKYLGSWNEWSSKQS